VNSGTDNPNGEPEGGATPSADGDGASLLTSMVAKVRSMSREDLEQALSSVPEEKRQRIIAAFGSVRAVSRSDIENAIRNDQEWSPGLSPWRRWVARRIIALTEYFLDRTKPK
jgi:L-rhamnose isomerase